MFTVSSYLNLNSTRNYYHLAINGFSADELEFHYRICPFQRSNKHRGQTLNYYIVMTFQYLIFSLIIELTYLNNKDFKFISRLRDTLVNIVFLFMDFSSESIQSFKKILSELFFQM